MARKRRDGVSRRAAVPSPNGAEQQVLDLLSQLGVDPSVVAREPSEAEQFRTDAAADSALQRILASPRSEVGQSAVRRHGERASGWATAIRRSRFLAVAVCVGVVVAAVAITRPAGLDEPSAPDRPAAAVVTPPMAEFSLVSNERQLEGGEADAELRKLAAEAAKSSADGSGPVHHVRLDGWYFTEGPKTKALVPTVTDRYFLPSGQMRLVESRGMPLDEFGRVRSRPSHVQVTADETFAGPATGAGYADQLPADPQQLKSRLVPNKAECPILAECLAQQIIELNYTWVPRPDLKSALWLTFVGEEAVRYLGSTRDRLGRDAVAFSVPTTDAVRRIVIYADPKTGELLGSEDVVIRRTADDGLPADVSAPAVVTFTAIAASERIDESGVPEQAPDPS